MSVNFERFKNKYDDRNLKFFYKLLPEAQNYYKKLLFYLENSIVDNKETTWFSGITGLKSVAEDMCFDKIKGFIVNPNKPNQQKFDEIKVMIEEILELSIPQKKRKFYFF